jgi:tetratricopeptide (TPR) repeat protein
MGARKAVAGGLLALAAGVVPLTLGQSTNSVPAGSSQTQSSGSDTTQQSSPAPSSTTTIHQRTGPYSSRTIRHTKVPEESPSAPELAQAEEFIQKQDYAAAEPLLRKVVDRDGGNYVAWFDLGFAENGLGKTEDSIAAYRKSVAAKPDVFESNLNLGLQLAKAGQPEAERFLRAATQLKPTSHIAEGQSRAWLSLGHVLKSKPEEALSAYRQAASLTPDDAEPHVAAGQLLEEQNRFSDAEQQYKEAVKLDPGSDALTGLANIYMRGRRFNDAEEYLRKLIAAHPENTSARIQLGRVLAAEGKYDDAIAELEAATKAGAGAVSVQRDLADLYSMAGKNEQAESAYRTLLTARPNEADLHQHLAQALLRQKKFPDAQQELLTAIKLKPDFGEAYGDLAFVANENKDYGLAIKALDARAKYLAEIPVTYFLRASAFDHLRDYKQAAANYHLFLNAADGKYPDQEWQAKHRLIAIEPKK